jgi:hypothetical protein
MMGLVRNPVRVCVLRFFKDFVPCTLSNYFVLLISGQTLVTNSFIRYNV